MVLDELPKRKANYVLWLALASVFMNILFIVVTVGGLGDTMSCSIDNANNETFVENHFTCTQNIGFSSFGLVIWCTIAFFIGILAWYVFSPTERKLLSIQDCVDEINNRERPAQVYLVSDFNFDHIIEGLVVLELKKDKVRRCYRFGVQPHPSNQKEWLYTWLGSTPETLKDITMRYTNNELIKQNMLKSQERAFKLDDLKKREQDIKDIGDEQ